MVKFTGRALRFPMSTLLKFNAAALAESSLALGVGVGAADGGTSAVTAAEANLVGSALLMAVTRAVPALAGAVKSPAGVMVPSEVFHVTDLSAAVP